MTLQLHFCSLILSVFFVTVAVSQVALLPLKTDTPPVIDGNLDDRVWQKAPTVSGFKTFAPDFGKDGSENTVVLMAYDSENLYFAFRCQDREPEKIKAAVAGRDNVAADDWVCINLDSYNDQQSLYGLYVNPLGIQMDSRFSAGNEDFSFDLVFYSAGRLESGGYSVEVRVPLKSLRYTDNNPVTMTVFFERYISRKSEHSSHPALDPAQGFAFLPQMKPMLYYDLKHYTLFELLPAFTYSLKYRSETGTLKRDENRGKLSLTTKFGITSDLILDGTYNPDFSQIEADAGQVDVNLRYALFYPEKRPFFLEGSEIYTIAATQISELDPVRSVIHTRTINNPLTGLRLSGKLGAKNTFASMYVLDRSEYESPGTQDRYTQFPVLRYKRALSGDSHIGGILTSRESEHTYNRVLGIDGMFRIENGSAFAWNGLYSTTKPQKSDNAVIGETFGLYFGRDSRNIYYDVGVKHVSAGFALETGYVTRTGIITYSGTLRPKFYPELESFQRIDAEVFSAQTLDRPAGLWETFNHVSVQGFFLGALTAKVKYSYSTEIFGKERFNTGGFHVLVGGQFSKQLYLSVLYRRVDAIAYSQPAFQGNSNRVTAALQYQPLENLDGELTFVYSDLRLSSNSSLLYEYPLFRGRVTYQFSKYLFSRAVLEYNRYRRQLLSDFLLSFTYIPGTVLYLGYGSLYEKLQWDTGEYRESDRFLETARGFFFKTSYLWRL